MDFTSTFNCPVCLFAGSEHPITINTVSDHLARHYYENAVSERNSAQPVKKDNEPRIDPAIAALIPGYIPKDVREDERKHLREREDHVVDRPQTNTKFTGYSVDTNHIVYKEPDFENSYHTKGWKGQQYNDEPVYDEHAFGAQGSLSEDEAMRIAIQASMAESDVVPDVPTSNVVPTSDVVPDLIPINPITYMSAVATPTDTSQDRRHITFAPDINIVTAERPVKKISRDESNISDVGKDFD
jgi:hypothetical protein